MLVPNFHTRHQREVLLASKTKEDEVRTVSDLGFYFKIKDRGGSEFYLEYYVTRNMEARTLTFDQHIYVDVPRPWQSDSTSSRLAQF